jgi:hypothetical protein
MPKADQELGLKIFSSETLCMHTGIRNMEAREMSRDPMWPRENVTYLTPQLTNT